MDIRELEQLLREGRESLGVEFKRSMTWADDATEIREFADYPVICSNDLVVGGTVVVVNGRMYCRSRRTIETTEVRTVEDLRDILEIAVDKGLNRYFRQRAIEDRVGKVVDDAERFRQQLEGL